MKVKLVLLSVSLLLLGSCVRASVTDAPATPRVAVACTKLGCDDVLTVAFVGHVPYIYTVNVSGANGKEVSVRCSKESMDCNKVTFFNFAPEEATITVQWDSSTITKTVRPSYSTWRPNGPHCPPECKSATVGMALPTPAIPTPGPQSIGMSRSNPFPRSEVVSVSCLEVQVLDVVRGAEAWQAIRSASAVNGPAPEGMEYLLVKLRTKSTCVDGGVAVGPVDFQVTGARRIRYWQASVVKPEPELDIERLEQMAEETEGWVALAVGQGETDLILVVELLGGALYRFIALEEGASVSIQPTDTGSSRSNPVPLGEAGSTRDWEITILEAVRGEDVWALVQGANRSAADLYNEQMELVAFKVHAHYIGSEGARQAIDGRFFYVTGDANIVYPGILPFGSWGEPGSPLDASLYPGGAHEGWVIEQAARGEADLMAMFYHFFTDKERAFFALEEGASISISPELATIEPTELGKERDDPVPLGETVTTEDWQVTILEAVRGDAALAVKKKIFRGTGQVHPPGKIMEYVAFKVRVRYIGTEEGPVCGSADHFNVTGSGGVPYAPDYIYSPFHLNDIDLFPDGQYEKWLVFYIVASEKDLVAVFEPQKRFLSLEP